MFLFTSRCFVCLAHRKNRTSSAFKNMMSEIVRLYDLVLSGNGRLDLVPLVYSHSLSVTVVYVLKLREMQILKSFSELHFWRFTKNGLIEFS